MPKTRSLLTAALLIVAACSSKDGDQSSLLSNSAGTGMAGSTAAQSGGRTGGATGGTIAVAGRGSVTAGQGTGGVAANGGGAGQSSAGTPATVGGTGGTIAGAPAAGMGAAAGAGAAGAAAGAPGGTAGASGAGTAGSSGTTAGSVMIQFTTVSYGGEYAPLNYGAVWFEKGPSGFVKTVKRWAGAAHATDLATWTMASGGWGSVFGGGGNTADMMDALSSATLRMHQTHMVTWNMMDAQKQLVPDGDYVAVIEMSESRARDAMGPVLRIKFTKGPMAQTVMMPDEKSFTGISLRYTP